ncbi:CBS domain-containing protein [Antarcticibacterium flavum]|uniref:CBS domain-containing protein n=1 Tax=Antarcticibacterium flavum TaxID=2058175 RepID=A0A5B7X1S5_9FLAO|nr:MULTISPECIES: nucleotidyltransferase family protein [Antarcticibacterium]MCM4158777.1 mannose-1-phosphate guanylyltransferase [Antarcticibacterium sp. W02-3]QCY68628.1 CBS domain-containing protein [Antarcticibacterium flavum]
MTDKTKLEKIKITPSASLQEALKQMDREDGKLLIVIEENTFKSLISIGDIQRAILKGKSLDTSISEILRPEIKVARPEDDYAKIIKLMKEYRMEFIPVITAKNKISEIYFWEDVVDGKEHIPNKKLSFPVVIMAGGKGTRLRPITNIIPKPLIPIGEKPIVEWIIDSFHKVGVQNFYLTVNYKQEMIRSYFDNLFGINYKVQYFEENKPLGTAGSLHLLKEELKETFFVTNCDILIKDDYTEMLNYHQKNGNELTAVSAVKHFAIPYGTMEFGENGILHQLKEKPEFNFFINAGMYILEPHLLNEIPENEFFHITTLMEKIMARNGKVGVFPVSEGSWMDIGQWDEYNKTAKRLGYTGIN